MTLFTHSQKYALDRRWRPYCRETTDFRCQIWAEAPCRPLVPWLCLYSAHVLEKHSLTLHNRLGAVVEFDEAGCKWKDRMWVVEGGSEAVQTVLHRRLSFLLRCRRGKTPALVALSCRSFEHWFQQQIYRWGPVHPRLPIAQCELFERCIGRSHSVLLHNARTFSDFCRSYSWAYAS